jgi:hypothetical protein
VGHGNGTERRVGCWPVQPAASLAQMKPLAPCGAPLLLARVRGSGLFCAPLGRGGIAVVLVCRVQVRRHHEQRHPGGGEAPAHVH